MMDDDLRAWAELSERSRASSAIDKTGRCDVCLAEHDVYARLARCQLEIEELRRPWWRKILDRWTGGAR